LILSGKTLAIILNEKFKTKNDIDIFDKYISEVKEKFKSNLVDIFKD
jgi:hypothetical protein